MCACQRRLAHDASNSSGPEAIRSITESSASRPGADLDNAASKRPRQLARRRRRYFATRVRMTCPPALRAAADDSRQSPRRQLLQKATSGSDDVVGLVRLLLANDEAGSESSPTRQPPEEEGHGNESFATVYCSDLKRQRRGTHCGIRGRGCARIDGPFLAPLYPTQRHSVAHAERSWR